MVRASRTVVSKFRKLEIPLTQKSLNEIQILGSSQKFVGRFSSGGIVCPSYPYAATPSRTKNYPLEIFKGMYLENTNPIPQKLVAKFSYTFSSWENVTPPKNPLNFMEL